MRNHSNENEFDLHENGHVGETHFHMNCFAPRLVLKQRQRVTRKWPIASVRVIYIVQVPLPHCLHTFRFSMAFVYFENIAVSSILQLINHCCAIAFILTRVQYY